MLKRFRDAPNTREFLNWFESMPAGSLMGLVIAIVDLDAEHGRLRSLGMGAGAIYC
jgi:hypothetical protein